MKKNIKNLIAIILSIILVLFIWHTFLINGNTVILIILLLIFYKFFKQLLNKIEKRKVIICSIISILFALTELICTSINNDYTLNNILDKWIILNFLGYAILAWSSIVLIYNMFENNSLQLKNIKLGKYEILSDSIFSFFINIVLILLAWLPYFLRYYPGLLTADSCAQVAQALGIAQLTNHHPIFHTGIISIFINTGNLFLGDINKSVALYIIFQMIAMATAFSIVLQYISKKNAPLIVRIVILLYYMFYPINALFSITMWKDILFAGIIPIYVILTIELINNPKNFLEKRKFIFYYVIVSILVMFLRNNGLYIVILNLPIIILILKKYWKKMITISLIILLMYFSLKTIIFGIFNVKNGSVGEMLSIPLQQIARTKKYHKEEMDTETIEEINRFFKCENIEEKYNPIISDPVKAELNNDYFDNNKVRFLKLWFKLLKVYFKDYVESFISNSYGYYYPEAKYWVANRTMEKNNMGISQHSLIKGELVSRIDSTIEKRDIPIISMFFSIGMMFWMIAISLGFEIYQKRYKNAISYFIIFILWLTIIASPVFCEYRYAYPMFTTFPVYLSLNLAKKGKNISKK